MVIPRGISGGTLPGQPVAVLKRARLQEFIRINHPQANGKAERIVCTLMDVWHNQTCFKDKANRSTQLISVSLISTIPRSCISILEESFLLPSQLQSV